jgi:excisionase family DNA binding protein
MNKKEAAAYLNVSTRAIERYTAQGKLTPTYEKGRTGPAPVYDQAQLDELKKQMDEAGDVSHSTVQHDKPAKHDKHDKHDRRDNKDDALVLRSGSRADLAAFIAALDKARGLSVADIAAKPLLTRTEAQRYTGLSRELLHEAVESGKVKEVKLGRSYRIKRTDLDAYIEQL